MDDMTTPAVKNSFVANEPAIVAHFVLWVVTNIGLLVVGHTHLITSAQWGSLTTAVVPLITALVLGLSATLLRKYVSPAWKTLTGWANQSGVPLSEIEAIVENMVTAKLAIAERAANPPVVVQPPAAV